MNLTRKRWHLLVVSCVINLFAGSLYAWSVFGAALADRLTAIGPDTVTSADLALAFGLANAVGPITMISGGAVNDRFGPKFVIAGGSLSLRHRRDGARNHSCLRSWLRARSRLSLRLHRQQHDEVLSGPTRTLGRSHDGRLRFEFRDSAASCRLAYCRVRH